MADYSLQEAASLVGVSVITLRRSISSGDLEPLPRRSSRSPIRVTLEALERARYSVTTQADSVTTQSQSLSVAVEAVKEELRSHYESQIEELQERLGLTTQEHSELLERYQALEIAAATDRARLEERRTAFDELSSQIAGLTRTVAAIESQSVKPRARWRLGRR